MADISWASLSYLLPEILLLIIALALVLFPRGDKKLPFYLSMLGLLAAGLMEFSFLGENQLLFQGTIQINTFSNLLKIVFIILSLINIIGSRQFVKEIYYSKEYLAFLLVASCGLMILSSAGDLLTLFIAFELVSISTYALPLIDEREANGKEAALKYFLAGAFSSALILYGLSLIYGLTGTIFLADIMDKIALSGVQPILLVALVFLLGGFGYKMALVPFHLWAPDTYQGSPGPVSAFLAGVSKKGAFVVALKIFILTLVAAKMQSMILLAILAFITMTVGNIVALMQQNTKRMIAYSSVAHAGNILVGLAIYSQLSVAGSILHIIAHGLMTIGIFFGILLVKNNLGGDNNEDFAGLSKTAPWTALSLMILLLSLAGVPPFLGFWSKMVIVVSAFERGGWLILLALALVLNSALSLVYYARIIKIMYMGQASDGKARVGKKKIKENTSYSWALYICAIILTVSGLFPEQIIAICTEAASFIVP